MYSTSARAALLALCIACPLAAQETPSDTLLTVGHYLNIEGVSDPQISPDGSLIVYTRTWVNVLEDHRESSLWIMNADGTQARFLTKGSSARWSPDGTRLLYVAEGEPKGAQLFVRWVAPGGDGTQISHVLEAPGDAKWSSDGKWVGFTMFVPKAPEWKIDLPSPPEGAKWTGAPRYVDRLHFRQDGEGFQRPGLVHLFVLPADGGTPRDVTPGEWSVGVRFDGLVSGANWSWSADGKTIAVDGLNDADADYSYTDSNILAIDLNSGAVRRLTPARGSWTSPHFSPDGSQIAFVGVQYPASDSAYHTQSLYLVNPDGSGLRNVSPAFDRDPAELAWANDGSTIYFTAEDRGSINISRIAMTGCGKSGCEITPVTSGAQVLSLGSVAKSGIAAITRATAQAPADITGSICGAADSRRGSRT